MTPARWPNPALRRLIVKGFIPRFVDTRFTDFTAADTEISVHPWASVKAIVDLYDALNQNY